MRTGGLGKQGDALVGGEFGPGEKPVPFSKQEIACVQRGGFADLSVKGRFTITDRIGILDVVVDERRLVETLNRQQNRLQKLGQLGSTAQHEENGGRKQRTVVPALRENPDDLVFRESVGTVVRKLQQPAQRFILEEPVQRFAKILKYGQGQRFRFRNGENLQQKFRVGNGIPATVNQQRHADAGDAVAENRRKGLFHRLKTGDADDRVHRPLLDPLAHAGAGFGYQYGNAVRLRRFGERRYATRSAILAEKPHVVAWRPAPVMVPQTYGKEQQPLVAGKRGKDRLPQRIVEKDGRIVVETGIRQPEAIEQMARPLPELGKGQRRDQPCFGNDLPGRIQDQATGLGIGRNALFLAGR